MRIERPMRTAAKGFIALVLLVAAWRSWTVPGPEPAPDASPRQTISPEGDAAIGAKESILIEMPRLIGVDDSFAKHVLELADLRTGTIRLEPSLRPWGSVIGQSVAPGTSVTRGARVDLVLAEGSVPEPCRLYWCSTRLQEAERITRNSSTRNPRRAKRTSGGMRAMPSGPLTMRRSV